jgi:hypothetical protein
MPPRYKIECHLISQRVPIQFAPQSVVQRQYFRRMPPKHYTIARQSALRAVVKVESGVFVLAQLPVDKLWRRFPKTDYLNCLVSNPRSISVQERRDLLQLTTPLPSSVRDEIVALWDEYEQAASLEARIAKGLDKLETILQHNQGAMPDDFDFRFNLEYGAKYTNDDPVLRTIRTVLDEETERRARAQELRAAPPAP